MLCSFRQQRFSSVNPSVSGDAPRYPVETCIELVHDYAPKFRQAGALVSAPGRKIKEILMPVSVA